MEYQIGKILYIVKYILIFIILICSIISIITVLHYEDGYLASRADTYNWHNPNFKYISVKSISHDFAYTDDIYETRPDILKAHEVSEIVCYSNNCTGEL